MITIKDYFGKWMTNKDVTDPVRENAKELIARVNMLLDWYRKTGGELHYNPCTGNCVSGETFGGFRPQFCTIGAPASAHKTGMAVDVYDPDGKLDDWITDSILETVNLYREAPSATAGWTHLSIRAPKSGKRSFLP